MDDELFGSDRKQVIRRRGRSEKVPATAHIGTAKPIEITTKSAIYHDKLTQEHGVIGFINESGMPCHPQGISIKGVCDHVDSHRNTAWQYYAAANDASAARAFLDYRDSITGKE